MTIILSWADRLDRHVRGSRRVLSTSARILQAADAIGASQSAYFRPIPEHHRGLVRLRYCRRFHQVPCDPSSSARVPSSRVWPMLTRPNELILGQVVAAAAAAGEAFLVTAFSLFTDAAGRERSEAQWQSGADGNASRNRRRVRNLKIGFRLAIHTFEAYKAFLSTPKNATSRCRGSAAAIVTALANLACCRPRTRSSILGSSCRRSTFQPRRRLRRPAVLRSL